MLSYLGYWPSQNGAQSNFGYLLGMSEGNNVEFPVELAEASAFSSVELSLDNSSNDEWQTTGIYIGTIGRI